MLRLILTRKYEVQVKKIMKNEKLLT